MANPGAGYMPYKPLYEVLAAVPERVATNGEQLGLGYLNILPSDGQLIQLCLSATTGEKGKLIGKLAMLTPNGDVVLTQCTKVLLFGAQSGKKFYLGIVKVPRTHILSLFWEAPAAKGQPAPVTGPVSRSQRQ